MIFPAGSSYKEEFFKAETVIATPNSKTFFGFRPGV